MPAAFAHVSFKPLTSGPSPPVQPARRGKGVRREAQRLRRNTEYHAASEVCEPQTQPSSQIGLPSLPGLAQQSFSSVRRLTSSIFFRSHALPQAAASATVATVAAVRTIVFTPVLYSASKVRAAASESLSWASAQLPTVTDGRLRLMHSSQIRL